MNSENKKSKILYLVAAAAAVAALVAVIVFSDSIFPSEISRSSTVMNTVLIQKLSGRSADKTGKLIEAQLADLENNVLSAYSASSEVSKINASDGAAFEMSDELYEYLNTLKKLSSVSDGAFDFSLGRLISLWDIGGENEHLPEKPEIQSALGSCGLSNVTVSGKSISLANSVQLNLGAAGKGIACDRAKKTLVSSPCKSAVVAVGGSILLWSRDGGKEFSVGIRDPRSTADKYMGVLKLKSCCVSTSGDYERCFVAEDSTIYHHIFSPSTGYPANSGVISVTVVSDSGIVSDALSTACFVLGIEKSLPLLKQYNSEAVFITSDKRVICTGGVSDSFSLSDDSYSLAE